MQAAPRFATRNLTLQIRMLQYIYVFLTAYTHSHYGVIRSFESESGALSLVKLIGEIPQIPVLKKTLRRTH